MSGQKFLYLAFLPRTGAVLDQQSASPVAKPCTEKDPIFKGDRTSALRSIVWIVVIRVHLQVFREPPLKMTLIHVTPPCQ